MDLDYSEIFAQASIETKPSEDIKGFLGKLRDALSPPAPTPGWSPCPCLRVCLQFLIDWINGSLHQEHIVVKSLEEDLFDGLILHHLLGRHSAPQITCVHPSASVYMTMYLLSSVPEIHSRDLLATLHLLVAMAKHFKPELELPASVSVEVLLLEVSKNGIKSEKMIEYITDQGVVAEEDTSNPMDELLKLGAQKVNTVKQAILHFVNKNLFNLGLSVSSMDSQFSDGVILILLIGQLNGYFVHLNDFCFRPTTTSEMLQNVSLALELLKDQGLLQHPVAPEDIVSQDVKATLSVLYALFKKYKGRAEDS
ncbi:gamma-parvin-like [Huso huso]|uniref:Gamma-parvin-like n=1 Tax=Huso huso TaxID=61971 RepID=A0ABR0ZCG8_HUSHU